MAESGLDFLSEFTDMEPDLSLSPFSPCMPQSDWCTDLQSGDFPIDHSRALMSHDSGLESDSSGNSPSYLSESSFLPMASPQGNMSQNGDDLDMNSELQTVNFDDLFQTSEDQELANYLSGNNDVYNSDLTNSCVENLSRPNTPDVDVITLSEPENTEVTKKVQIPVTDGLGVKKCLKVKVIKIAAMPSIATQNQSKAVEDEEVVEKNKKNAIQARLNRQKKKEYISRLESETSSLKKENDGLKSKMDKLQKDRNSLQEEVAYLRNVLLNQSTLSSLLQNIGNVENVKLSSSFSQAGKRGMEHDHDYNQCLTKRRRVASRETNAHGGVCLHVDKDQVSLEFCAACSKKANSAS